MSIKGFNDFRKRVTNMLKEFHEKEEKFLTTLGAKTEAYAKEKVPWKSGTLSRSIKFVVLNDKVIIGSNVEYAPAQEKGAVVKPKKGKALAIPYDDKVRKEVEKLGSAKAVIRSYEMRGYNIYGTIMKSSNDKDSYVIVAKKKRGKPKPLFTITKKTEIKGKFFLTQAKNRVFQEIPEIIRNL